MERRGRETVRNVLGAFFGIVLVSGYWQLSPSDVNTGLADPETLSSALRPAGFSLVGWLYALIWLGLVIVTYRGNDKVRRLVALLAMIRGGFALFQALSSGLKTPLALLFLAFGIVWLIGAFVLFRSPEIHYFLARQRERQAGRRPA